MSFDPPERNAAFKENEEFAFPLWTDAARELALYYGAATTETQPFANRITVLLDADGTWLLVYTLSGIDGLYAHAQDVLDDYRLIFGE